MNLKTDTHLVALARKNDASAFSVLIERHFIMALRLAKKMVLREDIAQELVQEAILKVYLSLGSLREDDAFSSWLYSIVLNTCRGYLRDQRQSIATWDIFETDEANLIDSRPSSQDILEEQELNQKILQIIKTLSPRMQETTLLFYYDQLSLKEVAAIQGVAVGTIKSRLHQARIQLKEPLTPLYKEYFNAERRKTMKPVTITDFITIHDRYSVIYLMDETNQRCLPIPTDRPAGYPAQYQSVGSSSAYNLMADILEFSDGKVEEVCIEPLHNSVVYATVKVRQNQKIRNFNARPSDAIDLAVRMNSPVFVNQTLLDEEGVDLAEIEHSFTLEEASGVLTVIKDNQCGFLRVDADLKPDINDIYVSPSQVYRFQLKDGDIVQGLVRSPGNKLKNLSGFAGKLRDSEDPLSKYLRSKLPPNTQSHLKAYDQDKGNLSASLRSGVIDGLKQMLEDPALYDAKRFEHVALSEETQMSIGKAFQQIELYRLNQRLLEEAYPDLIANDEEAEWPFYGERFRTLMVVELVNQRSVKPVDGGWPRETN